MTCLGLQTGSRIDLQSLELQVVARVVGLLSTSLCSIALIQTDF